MNTKKSSLMILGTCGPKRGDNNYDINYHRWCDNNYHKMTKGGSDTVWKAVN